MTKNLPHQPNASDDDLDIGLDSEDETRHVAIPLVERIAKNTQQSGKPANLENDEGWYRI